MNTLTDATPVLSNCETSQWVKFTCHRLSPLLLKVHWQKLSIKITIWLLLEIYLNWIGIDTLADISEFILITIYHKQQSVLVI
jgi:hypothetical protein